jgi:hypothetical protein
VKLFEPGSLWSYKGYRLFWISNAIFVLGSTAFPIALAVTVLDTFVVLAYLFAGFSIGPWEALFGEKELLIGSSIFHVIFCLFFLRVPGVKDFKIPANYSHGEHKQA